MRFLQEVNMRPAKKAQLIIITAGILVSALYLYRTLELGRGAAQTVLLLENLNPVREMKGPDGLQIDAGGNIYVGAAPGLIWNLGQGGEPEIYADLSRLQDSAGSTFMNLPDKVGGLVFDEDGNLYCATYDFAGGSVLQVSAIAKDVRIFARDMGSARSLAVSQDGSQLWVSDFRSAGRILRYPLNASLPVQPDLIIDGLAYPGAITFSLNEKTLYVAETYSGNIKRIGLSGDKPSIQQIINLKGSFALGSLTGLGFDPRDEECRFLYVAENIRGIFAIVDLNSNPPHISKCLRLVQMGSRPCPASLIIRDGYLYFTDVWACSPARILIGMPKWHNHAYRFRVNSLANIY
jgi:hypothetical protein